jgi:hypothetical protein
MAPRVFKVLMVHKAFKEKRAPPVLTPKERLRQS